MKLFANTIKFNHKKPNQFIYQINQVQKEINVILVNQINFNKTKYIENLYFSTIITLNKTRLGLFKLKSLK